MSRIYRVDVPTLLPSGEQAIWSHWLESPGDETELDGAVSAADDFMTSLSTNDDFGAFFSASITFGPVKVSEVTKATGVVVATLNGTVSFPGGNIEGPLPPQCSAVVSLGTLLAGASHRGRYYLPSPYAGSVVASGRFRGDDLDNLVAALVLAHTEESSALGEPILVVYSRKLHSTTAVQYLRIGDVVDTQRRRRDKLIETYHIATL